MAHVCNGCRIFSAHSTLDAVLGSKKTILSEITKQGVAELWQRASSRRNGQLKDFKVADAPAPAWAKACNYSGQLTNIPSGTDSRMKRIHGVCAKHAYTPPSGRSLPPAQFGAFAPNPAERLF